MTAAERLERYVNLFRVRLKMLTGSRAAAILSAAALLVTLIAVTVAIRSGFPASIVIASRLILLVVLVSLFVYAVVLPNRRIDDDRGAADTIEKRAPSFAGRVSTYLGMRDQSNPLRELLADDAMRVADQHAPEDVIPQREFSWALGVAGAALTALLVLAIAGPGNYAYGVRHLWIGWAFPNATPPQNIAVSPGDDGIRAGGTVRVRATTEGFSPGDAYVHARFGDDEWQRVAMARDDSDFVFTFFSVREPLQYYVSAASVRSETFEIQVVDLPSVERLITTYRFPEWTNREPEVRDPGGDVRTIAETDVSVEIRAFDPLPTTVLIVDDEEIPLTTDGGSGEGSFTVEEDGRYYVAAVVGGERIRLTDDYFISVLDDDAPSIQFSRPGRDWSASSIEEVTTSVTANDDFLIESLELRYSVNGGDWQSVELPAGEPSADASHVFALESLTHPETNAPLAPGDLISYYAVAGDREQSASTDIFFVDVQPFDRRYSQSQMSGGGGQQGGGAGDEISQRQREIIVSTWNLIREAKEQRRADADYVPNNAELLSRLQTTLKQQAETLAARTRARQLTATDDQIAEFVENLDKAAEAMVPAAERLAAVDLEDAILPEQEALQHLLRAEAVFTDISVSLQANNRSGGGGGRAGRDLTDMFELEMDLEKNQYETGSRATPTSEEQQLDDIGDELEELARRQEQLAERMNRNQATTPAERWQQDMLRRDLEQLLEEMQQMQQQSANNQSSQSGGAQSSSSGQPQSGEPSDPSDQQQAENNRERRMDQLQSRLNSALRAMNDAEAAMRQGADREELQQAAAEAQRQLERARDQAAADRESLTQESLAALGERADDLYDRQADIERRLQDAIRSVLNQDDNDDRLGSGMSLAEEYAMAREKRELQSDLQGLEQDLKGTAQALEPTDPASAETIEDALRQLREDEVEARLAVSAAYIEQGEAVYVSASESAITEALRDLVDAVREAAEQSELGGPSSSDGQEGGLSQTLADTRDLRRQLQSLRGGFNPNGGATNRGRDDLQQSTGVRVPDLEVTRDFSQDFDNLSDDVLNLFRGLRQQGVPERAIDELRQLAGEVRASDFSGNEALLEREAQVALNLVEQLELALSDAQQSQNESVRTNAADNVPDDHKAPVANYYRRLGQDGRDGREESEGSR